MGIALRLSDTEALIVLHFAVFYLAVFSLYSIVKSFLRTPWRPVVQHSYLVRTHIFFMLWMGLRRWSNAIVIMAFRCARGAAVRLRWRWCIFLGRRDLRNGVYVYFGRSVVPVQIGMFLLVNRSRSGDRACGGSIICRGIRSRHVVFRPGQLVLGGPFRTSLIKSMLYRPSLQIVSKTMSLYFHGRRKRTGFLQRR